MAVTATARLSDADLATQNAMFVEALVEHSPQAVKTACEEWGRRKKFWPSLAELLELVAQREPANPGLLDESTVSGRICARERRLAAASGLTLTEVINRVSADIMPIIALETRHQLTDDVLAGRIGLGGHSAPQTDRELRRRMSDDEKRRWLDCDLGRTALIEGFARRFLTYCGRHFERPSSLTYMREMNAEDHLCAAQAEGSPPGHFAAPMLGIWADIQAEEKALRDLVMPPTPEMAA